MIFAIVRGFKDRMEIVEQTVNMMGDSDSGKSVKTV